ncbi:MAG: hypothetical protein ABI778_07370 [Ignavibacteriota bacterium]
MKHFSKFSAILFLLVFALFAGGNSCFKEVGTTGDDCGLTTSAGLAKVIHGGDAYDLFDLVTPAARNDCEATYTFIFRWADENRSKSDSTQPPLSDLEHSFGPEDQFAYFAHPVPTRSLESKEYYIWSIKFSIGNKNTSLPATRYGVHVNVESTKPEDSIRIGATIAYYPKN